MVSKASEDLPEPDRPVITISRSRGRSRSMFLRLCVRAPRMRLVSMALGYGGSPLLYQAVQYVCLLARRSPGDVEARRDSGFAWSVIDQGFGRSLQAAVRQSLSGTWRYPRE